jgi:hypothetical protein
MDVRKADSRTVGGTRKGKIKIPEDHRPQRGCRLQGVRVVIWTCRGPMSTDRVSSLTSVEDWL